MFVRFMSYSSSWICFVSLDANILIFNTPNVYILPLQVIYHVTFRIRFPIWYTVHINLVHSKCIWVWYVVNVYFLHAIITPVYTLYFEITAQFYVPTQKSVGCPYSWYVSIFSTDISAVTHKFYTIEIYAAGLLMNFRWMRN